MTARKVIIDCDAGTDDAQAIMMALASTKVQVLAITAVFGNTELKNTSRNVLRILNVNKKPEIPVYAGCASSLIGNPSIGDDYHGKDGLGDVDPLYPPGDLKLKEENAVTALVRLAKEHKDELTLLTIGPLTNIATAMKLDPDFGDNLKEVVVMGGNTTGKGNITPSAEFNFYSDPEAAYAVLNHLNTKIKLISHELCEEFSFSWEWYEKYSNIQTDKARFVRDINKFQVDRDRDTELKYWCWDQLAAAVTIDASVALSTQEVLATVELHGTNTRGQVVINWKGDPDKSPNVCLVTNVDAKKYEKLLFAGIGHILV